MITFRLAGCSRSNTDMMRHTSTFVGVFWSIAGRMAITVDDEEMVLVRMTFPCVNILSRFSRSRLSFSVTGTETNLFASFH